MSQLLVSRAFADVTILSKRQIETALGSFRLFLIQTTTASQRVYQGIIMQMIAHPELHNQFFQPSYTYGHRVRFTSRRHQHIKPCGSSSKRLSLPEDFMAFG
jgi:hypothetical protein